MQNLANGTDTLIGPAEFKNPGQGVVPTNRCYQVRALIQSIQLQIRMLTSLLR